MDLLNKDDKCSGDAYVKAGSKDIQVQLVISLALGVSAFLAFSVCAHTCLLLIISC